MKMTRKIILLLTGILLTSTVFSQIIYVTELKKANSPKMVVKVRFTNGSIADPVGKEGLTNLTASLMMDGGTNLYTKSQINDITYPMSAYYYANTDKEVTTFTFAFPKDFIDEFYPILTGLILHPTLDSSDFSRIKSNTLNYLTQVIRASSDEDFSKFALEEMLFEGTPYAHLVSGTVDGLNAITLEDVKSQYANFFTNRNVSIGIAGDFPNEYVEKLKADLGKLPSKTVVLPEIPEIKMPDGINIRIVEKEDALGSAIYTGYPIDITREDDEFAALMIANSWLGEHRKSYGQLYSKIRETRSMNYGDYSYIEWYDNGGRNQLPVTGVPRNSNYFALWIRPVQIGDQLKQQYPELSDITIGHAHFALRLAIREMDLMVKNGMDKEEFEKTKQFLRSYMKLYIQTPEKELGFLMDSHFYNRKDYIKEMDKLLEKTTLEEVNAAIRKYFQTANMDIVIITDDSEAKPLAASFKNNTTSKMSYADQLKAELPQEVLDEDSEVENYPLNVKSVEIISSEEPFVK
jgi:zinc protease